MNTDELVEKYNDIKDLPVAVCKGKIYELLEALDFDFEKTDCPKCLADYRNIIGEELGLIDSADSVSDF